MSKKRRVQQRSGNTFNRRGLMARTGAGAIAAGVLAGGLPAAALAAPASQQSRQISIAMSQEPTTLGYGIGNATVETIVKRALGSQPPLTVPNDLLDYIPWVAQNVPTLENGGAQLVGEGSEQRLEVVFDLRPDAVWSDGYPVTAHDVRFAWELIMHPDYPVSSREFHQKIQDIEVVDDHQLIVKFMNQDEAREAAVNGRNVSGPLPPTAFRDLATQEGPVLDPNYYKSDHVAYPRHILQPLIEQLGVANLRTADVMRRPVGIGPYRVREWVPGQAILLEAVPSFFLGAPRTAQLVFRLITDTNALLAQLATGEVDIVEQTGLSEFQAPELDRLEAQRRIRAYYVTGTTWEHLDLNVDNPHLSDARVRRAIAYALNRQLMVDRVLNRKTTVIHSWSPTWRWDYNPEVVKYDFNPARARELLREAGYAPGPDGIMRKGNQRLSLKYYTVVGNQMRLLTSQIAQANLKDVGIEVQLEYLPIAEMFATAATSPGPLTARTFDIGQYAWSAPEDPSTTRNLYHSSAIPSRDNSYVGQNYPGFRDPRNDELLTLAANSLDTEARTQWYAEQQKLWTEALPVIPLFARTNVHATKRSVQNYRPGPTSTVPVTWNSHDWWLSD
jgi:peptide/nickel transport system substrate-binding protein